MHAVTCSSSAKADSPLLTSDADTKMTVAEFVAALQAAVTADANISDVLVEKADADIILMHGNSESVGSASSAAAVEEKGKIANGLVVFLVFGGICLCATLYWANKDVISQTMSG